MAVAASLDTLAPIREKVLAGARLDFDDGVALLECDDVLALGELADTARRLRGGTDEVFFVNNLYLNHTNVCRVKCKFCAFARTARQEGAYTWDIPELVRHAVDVHDETGGFLAFIPLPFHPENTVFERRGWRFSTGYDDLRMIAVSRLMLDNIPNVKAYWIMISTPLAQVALHFGANDIQGTVMEEQIAHAAGAVTPQEEKIQSLVALIREAGRIPVQRDTLYNRVRTFE